MSGARRSGISAAPVIRWCARCAPRRNTSWRRQLRPSNRHSCDRCLCAIRGRSLETINYVHRHRPAFRACRGRRGQRCGHQACRHRSRGAESRRCLAESRVGQRDAGTGRPRTTAATRALGLAAEPRSEDGLRETDDEALIRALLELEVRTPTADEASSLRYYRANQARFRSPDLFEPLHILFKAPRTDEAAYAKATASASAEAVLTEL